MKLLIAEDERDLADALTVLLERNKYAVDTVYNGRDAYEYARTGEYDGVILDVMMPQLTGLQVVTRLREDGVTTPVMLLTAKGQKDDRITGFDAGADDYLPKPFATDELLARIRALLRRSGDYKSTVLSVGTLSLDCGSGVLSDTDGSARLSGREFQIMELFMRSPSMIISADRIIERVWGWESDTEVCSVWVHISNLRKKLRSIDSAVEINAVRGMGYVLEAKA